MKKIQFLTDENGARQSAVIPIDLFNKLVEAADLDDFYESVPYAPGPNDDETIPHEVVGYQMRKGATLHAAWRMYRGLSQEAVAEVLGISQAGVANMEKRAKPQRSTLEKLAELYRCRVTQLIDD
ncbi:helix-turn-helix transcriptional regulator [Buttiauxella sp. A2-C1_F]|uniref:helix-turn-helix domain-containing protein n=1 Tax=Buttiauxella TaxID=82976 RepID=UPI00125FC8CE|nr:MULTISPECIES: helix-turn-helix transcriptional regulator [Buttiauxella]MCE0812528.1 helix-turn-helix transcriptional regulator [Buttiauxella sp. S04-F03]MCE0846488.1 helix-turn-helix transcriptional regulator [Buttiauxella sp. A2-C1_F]